MAYELVSDLVRAFRSEERDDVKAYFWPDDFLVRAVNEALTEFATRTLSIYDDMSAITRVDFGPGDGVLNFDRSILDVIEAYLEIPVPYSRTQYRPLRVVGPGYYKAWQLPYGGLSQVLVVNGSARQMALYGPPQVAGTLKLLVVRKPLAEVGMCDIIPDIPEDQRRHLLLYMKHKAYRVNDAEVFEPAKALDFEREFAAACQSVYEESLRRRQACTRTIRPRW